MARGFKALAAAAIAMTLAGGAMASEGDPSDVLGSWTFQTKRYDNGASTCAMTGMMRLTPAPEDGVYACELTAVEVCSLWGRSVVVQACEARRFGNQVSVRSQIVEMLESKFEDDSGDGLSFAYLPDNFALTIQDSQRMYGALVSAITAPVEFRRAVEGVS